MLAVYPPNDATTKCVELKRHLKAMSSTGKHSKKKAKEADNHQKPEESESAASEPTSQQISPPHSSKKIKLGSRMI
jgi:hypothetical protein